MENANSEVRWKVGERVCFAHMPQQSFAVTRVHPKDQMVEIEGMPGLFGAHIFVAAPIEIPPIELEPIKAVTSDVALAHSSFLPAPAHIVKQCQTCGGPIPSLDPQKLEALKVWYAVFAALLDEPAEDAWLVGKLRKLRAQVREQFPDAP